MRSTIISLVAALVLAGCTGGERDRNEATARPQNATRPAPSVPDLAPSGTPTLNSATALPNPGPMTTTSSGRLAADPAGGRAPDTSVPPAAGPPKARLSPDPVTGPITPNPDQRQ